MKQCDQVRAKRLLKIKTDGTKFRWTYLLQSKRLWIAIVVISILTIGAIMTPENMGMNRGIFCILGILIGRILRDMVWLKDIVDSFTFTEKIINWDKVKDIANKEQEHNQ